MFSTSYVLSYPVRGQSRGQSSHVAIAMYLTLCAMLLRCPAMCLLGGRCELRWLAGGMCDPVLINKPFKLQVPRACSDLRTEPRLKTQSDTVSRNESTAAWYVRSPGKPSHACRYQPTTSESVTLEGRKPYGADAAANRHHWHCLLSTTFAVPRSNRRNAAEHPELAGDG